MKGSERGRNDLDTRRESVGSDPVFQSGNNLLSSLALKGATRIQSPLVVSEFDSRFGLLRRGNAPS